MVRVENGACFSPLVLLQVPKLCSRLLASPHLPFCIDRGPVYLQKLLITTMQYQHSLHY